MYSHGQELFYKFVSDFTNKLVKQLLSMTVYVFRSMRLDLELIELIRLQKLSIVIKILNMSSKPKVGTGTYLLLLRYI